MDIDASLYLPVLFMDRNTFSKSWKVLCWNVRGINSDKKWVFIRDKITESNCDIVCLQETKKKKILIYSSSKNFVLDNLIVLSSYHQWELLEASSLFGHSIFFMVTWHLVMILVSLWNSALSMMTPPGC